MGQSSGGTPDSGGAGHGGPETEQPTGVVGCEGVGCEGGEEGLQRVCQEGMGPGAGG